MNERTFSVLVTTAALDSVGCVITTDEPRILKIGADRFTESRTGSLVFENYTGAKDGWVSVRTIAAGKWDDCKELK